MGPEESKDFHLQNYSKNKFVFFFIDEPTFRKVKTYLVYITHENIHNQISGTMF